MSSIDKLTALENELLVVRNELENLRSGRVHRTTSYIRRLLSSSARELPSVIKEAPQLLKRLEPPKLEKLSSSRHNFSPAMNPLPLLQFPNINVALVSNSDSYVDVLFRQTCNAFSATGELAKQINSYGAVQAIAIDADAYDRQTHEESVVSIISSGAKPIIFYSDENDIQQLPKVATGSALLIKHDVGSDTFPGLFADIYNLNQKTDTKLSASSKHHVESADSIKDIKHDSISIVPATLLESIAKSADLNSMRLLLERIASYCPVVIKGKKPSWIKAPLASFDSNDELEAFIQKLCEPYQADRYSIACGKSIILKSNTINPAYEILQSLGLVNKDDSKPKSISVILATKRAQHVEHALKQIQRQTIKPVDVLLMLHGISDEEYSNIKPILESSPLPLKVHRMSESTLFGDVLNKAVEESAGDLIAKFDDDDHYFPEHLEDLYAAYLSSCADVIGKWNNWVHLEAENITINWVPENANGYTKHIPGGTFLVKADLLRKVKFGKVRRAIDSELYRRAIKRGATLYSTHRYNYTRVRTGDHTYTISDAAFKERSDGRELPGLPGDIIDIS